MKIFFDTSAFVKRYVDEPNSDRVIEICRQADRLILSIICLPEIISTLNRLLRENTISADNYRRTKGMILSNLNDSDVCILSPEVIRRTLICLENNAIGAMDALHIGCALTVNPDLFISSDRRQIIAAQQEGLKVMEV